MSGLDPNLARDQKFWLGAGAAMLLVFALVIVFRLLNGLPL